MGRGKGGPMKTKRQYTVCFALLILGILPGLGFSQQPKAYVHFFGGLNAVFEYGCDCDYVLGENDFPLTPAHTTASVGISFGYFVLKGLALELDARYHTKAKVTLTDPSDQDRVNIDTAKHYTVTANVMYQFLQGNVRPYVLAGAGIDTLMDVETELLETEYGFVFELKEPDKKTEVMFNIGGGVEILLTGSLGIRFDARYVDIPKGGDHPKIQSVNASAGLTFRF
jgi:opacity protein-like surface antigen